MNMDIISGEVLVTSTFMLALALTALVAGRSMRDSDAPAADRMMGLARLVLSTLVVVYFVATTHLLLIAQQISLALGNFVIAVLLLAVLYGEGLPRVGRRARGDGEGDNWNR